MYIRLVMLYMCPIHQPCSNIYNCVGLLTVTALSALGLKAYYGRYTTKSWGPSLNAKHVSSNCDLMMPECHTHTFFHILLQ